VLAVSVFLALNLAMPALPLDTVILDDPLQSLDDMNLLGLVDLLRRTRERRQVLISTHDPRLAGLLERKLRPVRSDQRTIVIDIQGWSREGPVITQRDVEHDRTPLRIAAA
jgi:DNA repair exonuclease SbcCD ATPase subunit